MIGHMNVEEGRVQNHIAKMFREKREYLKMSQAKVATDLQKLGMKVHQSSYAKMETGERQIPMTVAMGLCTVLGVKWESLYQSLEAPEEKAQRWIQESHHLMKEVQVQLRDTENKIMTAELSTLTALVSGGGRSPNPQTTIDAVQDPDFNFPLGVEAQLEKILTHISKLEGEIQKGRGTLGVIVREYEQLPDWDVHGNGER